MYNKITITIPYYEAPDMLRKQLEYWNNYAPHVKDKLEVIVVDDGSQKYSAANVLTSCDKPSFPIRLYWIKENIPWNISGALNLAFTEAAEGWVFSGTMDHVFPSESIVELLDRLPDFDVNKYYRFPRIRFSTKQKEQSPGNLFLLTRKLFWEVGGYDEDFAGWYGGVGNSFKRELNRQSQEVLVDDIHILHYTSDVIPDSAVNEWGRKGSAFDWRVAPNKKKLQKKLTIYKPQQYLRFQWTRVF